MNFKHLRKRIMSESIFSVNIKDERIELTCDCLGYQSWIHSCEYPNKFLKKSKIEINDDIKHRLIGLIIEQNGFIDKLQQIENRTKNLNRLV